MSRLRTLVVAGFAAAIALSPARAIPQVPGAIPLAERPAGDIVFKAPALPVAGEKEYSYSLCLGTEPAMPTNQECGGSFHPATTIQGGHGPYHFQLESGVGFPPFGIHLDKDGNLKGKLSPGARASTFRVCAVDLDGAQSCQTMTMGVGAAAPAGQKAAAQADGGSGSFEGGSSGAKKAAIILGIAGGAGVGAALICKETDACSGVGNGSSGGSSSCGTAPVMPFGCEGSQRNSTTCNAWLSSYKSWCSCNGRTFNVNTGSCS